MKNTKQTIARRQPRRVIARHFLQRFVLVASALLVLASSIRAGRPENSKDGNGGAPTPPPGSASEQNPGSGTTPGGTDPVKLYTANANRSGIVDLQIWGAVGMIPMKWERIANSRDSKANSNFGTAHNWRHCWEWEMVDRGTNAHGQAQLSVAFPAGEQIVFTETSPGVWTSPSGVDKQLFQRGNDFVVQYQTGHRCRFEKLTDVDGTIFYQLQDIRDPEQNLFVLKYETSQPHRLLRITEPAGRFFAISYGVVGNTSVINTVTTSDGRSVKYSYSNNGTPPNSFVSLTTATYGDGTVARYTYVQQRPTRRPLLLQAVDPRISGRNTNMLYSYADVVNEADYGSIRNEMDGATGAILFTLDHQADIRKARYANGDVDLLTYPERQENNLDNVVDGLGRATSFEYDDSGKGFLIKRTDALGRVTKFKRSTYGNPLTILRPDRSQQVWTRDDLDLPLSYTDELGRKTVYTRDANHRVTRIDHPDGTFERFRYNGFGEVLDHQRRNGGIEHNVYDPRGLKMSFEDAEHNVTHYTYDSADRMASMTDARGNMMQFEYDERGLLTKKINAGATFQTYAYDEFGNRIKVTDELGHSWTQVYDEFRRVIESTDPLGRTTRFEYGLPTNFGESYDKPTKITLPSGLMITNEYDARWQLLSRTVGAGAADAATTHYDYDDVGNQIHRTDPRGFVWTTEYDVRNRKHAFSDPLGNRTQWDHDPVGNIITITRPDGGITRNEFDVMNRLIRTRDPKDEITQMAYDAEDNMITMTDARGNQSHYTYDLLNRKVSLIYPDSSHEDSTWDPASNLATYKTRAGQTHTYVYDARNRETDSSWDDGITPSISRTYDDASRLLTMNSSVSALTYTYTDANELESETLAITGAGSPKTIQYAYNLDGLRDTLTYPDGTVVTYGYTGRNQIDTISDGGSVDPLVNYDYDPNGNRILKTLENGTTSNYVYDEANRVTHIDHQNGLGVFASFDYVYDSVHRRSSVTHEDASVDLFAYDPVDQLISVNYGADNRSVSYLYDNVGNRRSVTDNGVTTKYKTNDLDEYTRVGGNFPDYDVNGNLTSSSGWTYSYDAQNRLISASNGTTAATFAYDSRNRRVQQTIDGETTFFYFDDWSLIDERDAGDVQQARYVNGAILDEILSKTAPAYTVYYHHDAIGDVTHLTDGTAAVVEKYSYDVFGAPTISNGSGNVTGLSAYGNRFLFTGREFISGLGLYDFRNRFYSSQFGRFLQTDLSNYHLTTLVYRESVPVAIQIQLAVQLYIVPRVRMYIVELPQEHIVPVVGPWLDAYRNLYTYVQNDPINLNDPSGNQSLDESPDVLSGQYEFLEWDAYNNQIEVRRNVRLYSLSIPNLVPRTTLTQLLSNFEEAYWTLRLTCAYPNWDTDPYYYPDPDGYDDPGDVGYWRMYNSYQVY